MIQEKSQEKQKRLEREQRFLLDRQILGIHLKS